MLFLLIGVGKNTLLPFNIWIIFAMSAPIPVSALLHAVLVVKIGVLLSIKIIYQIYGLEI
jgi:multicomponent Na+:H+ antiporter subunit D